MDFFDLKGKTALITGASSGLGERFARVLSSQGVRVILVARRFEKLEALAHELQNALPLQIDVANKESVQTGFEHLEKSNEKIDICINCAGIGKSTPIFAPENDFRFEEIMQTNVMGVWYVTRAIALHMKNHNIEGSIINISSINGLNRLQEKFASYCASKAAVIQLTKALVGELSREKIRINCIAPGLFYTPLTDYKLNTEEQVQERKKIIPLNFIADPSDLDGAILYLSSNKASRYVTGSCITIDGGASWGGG